MKKSKWKLDARNSSCIWVDIEKAISIGSLLSYIEYSFYNFKNHLFIAEIEEFQSKFVDFFLEICQRLNKIIARAKQTI